MKKVITLIGTRPEIIKMSTLIPRFNEEFNHLLVHSGQHYSENMDRQFFAELDLPLPQYNLQCGGLGPVEQVAEIMLRFDKIVQNFNPDIIVVHGDTNTTLAGALVAAKYKEKTQLAHVEAGCRSFNEKQAEEINRVIVDRISDFHFVSNTDDQNNLLNEKIAPHKIHLTGNTVIESCQRSSQVCDQSAILNKFKVQKNKYIFLTLHRQELVENENQLTSVFNAIYKIADQIKIIFPIHPRTQNKINQFNININHPNIQIVEPVGYSETMALVKNARLIMTDSGGLQEETTVLNTPGVVIRESTEYTHYIRAGKIFLPGYATDKILDIALKLINDSVFYESVKGAQIELPINITEKIVSLLKEASL